MELKKRLLVIGAGFGGLNLVKNIDPDLYEVTVVDRNNYHSFPPLFYQVASAGLEPANISFPLRRELIGKRSGVSFRMGSVQTIDISKKEVHTQYETIPYDLLVIAAGTTNNFFGIEGLREKVYTLKSTPEAIRCRNALLERMERAVQTKDTQKRRSLLSFVVVGGGPTGVEIAGAIGEVKRWVVKREYPEIDPKEVRVTLVEGTGRLLGAMSESSGKDALKALKELMVDVQLNKTMKSYDGHTVTFADGSTLEADTMIWTAGIRAESFSVDGGELPIGPGGRIIVDEYNRVQGIPDMFAIGDISLHVDSKWPKGMPQLAQPAIQQGLTLAKNLNEGSFKHVFSYRDKGSMATIGRNRAVVDMKHGHMRGWIAWMAWMVVHLVSLLGMRNKAVVLLNWCWSYFSYSSSLRVILYPSRYPKPQVISKELDK